MKKQQEMDMPSRPGTPFETCPECHSGDLLPQRPRGIKGWLMMIAGRKLYRCNRCGARRYRRPARR
jgi:hypothetical protein